MQAATSRHDNPFHAGEQAVHERLRIRERMVEVGQRVIRTAMPEQHRRFFEQLPFMLVGSVDAAGQPWASMLVGRPGFVRAPSDKRLDFCARPIPGDPLAEGLAAGAQLGFLGIELHTRRRNRVNGHVVAADARGFSVEVDQSVGNCPQYIQGREFRWARDASDLQPRATEALGALDAEARALIDRSDTLFIATQAPPTAGDPDVQTGRGADVSHRGGRPGFVKIEDDRTFLVPDFTGNFFFMTLGNLQLNPRAGVLFIDFETGDLLTLTGTAEVVWDGDELKAFDGAERAWRFRVEAGWRLREALPLRWAFRDQSPNSAITGTWTEAQARREAERLAQTWRPYRVTRVVDESRVIRSFHLAPADGHAVPRFEAGQHLPIRLKTVAGEELRRTYTISQAPSDEGLRLSVKRAGLASSQLHDHVREGDVIEALGPRGRFTIDAGLRRPAVLIGAGVGITPMVAFARHLVTEGFRHRRTRPLHLIQVARSEDLRAFGDELRALEQRAQRCDDAARGVRRRRRCAARCDPGPADRRRAEVVAALQRPRVLPPRPARFHAGAVRQPARPGRARRAHPGRGLRAVFARAAARRRGNGPAAPGADGHAGDGELHAQRRRRRVDARARHAAGVCGRQGPEPALLVPRRALRILRDASDRRPRDLCRAHRVAAGRGRGALVLRRARGRRWRTRRTGPVRQRPTIAG
jgi:ferredoxin-NADP reductase/predicted pyridoxine 5'-phosphate oxidase superfamily flavin-nucleotide-binding protein